MCNKIKHKEKHKMNTQEKETWARMGNSKAGRKSY